MTLENTVLQKLSDWHPPQGRQSLNVPDADAGWTVALTADRSDVLGCLVWDLTLHRRASVPANVTLSGWAERIAERATGLLEPLKVHEVDVERNEALLRSDGPTQRGDVLFYYEILLRGTTCAEVRRYQAARQANAPREQVAFALTHEALAKLVGDLTTQK
jgi:hypothetical protein